MKIGILALTSGEEWKNEKNELLNQLKDVLFKQGFDSDEVTNNFPEFDYVLTFVITGGTEGKFRENLRFLKPPYIIVAHPYYNSLPASLEIKAFLGKKGGIFLFEKEKVENELTKMLKVIKIKKTLNSKTIALIGNPSFWLIASSPPLQLIKERFGLEVKQVPLEELISEYERLKEEDVLDEAESILKRTSEIIKIDIKDIVKALKLKKSIESIREKEYFDYLSLECFSLIKPLDTTGCLALSLFNDIDLVSGCEGDLPSTLTMIILKEISGSPNFLGNISWVKQKGDISEVTLTHCTIATSILSYFQLTTHFETGKGVGIKGFLPENIGTLARIGGERLEKIFFRKAQITNNLNQDNLCRTQLLLEVENSKQYFLKEPLGNHHIWTSGNLQNELKIFAEIFNLEKI